MNPEVPAAECFTDYALQELAAGRLDAEIRVQVARHLETCPECREAHTDLAAEFNLLRAALAPQDPQKREPPFSEETLGLYLSGALDDAQTSALETMLAAEPALLSRLIALRTEVHATRAEAQGVAPISATRPEPLGQILKMPKRIRPTITVLTAKRLGGERAG